MHEKLLSEIAVRTAGMCPGDGPAFGPQAGFPPAAGFAVGAPLRCMAVMDCSEALDLVKEVGHASF